MADENYTNIQVRENRTWKVVGYLEERGERIDSEVPTIIYAYRLGGGIVTVFPNGIIRASDKIGPKKIRELLEVMVDK